MASSLAWFLVVEALGHVKQVDPALLVEMVKQIPNLSDDLGKNAREIVALRILENLYDRGIQNKENRMPLPGSQIEFDPFDSCEDVLHRIFQEASMENLKMGGQEIFRWNVHSFITHKKSSLPTCALQKLKNGILEGSNPSLAALKLKSGLTDTSGIESQSRIHIDGGDSDGIPHRPEGGGKTKDLCVKCHKHDNLLDCSTCPLVVHESCLGCTANFDESGKFYCPTCSFSQAISLYEKAKKNATLARKDLAAFAAFTERESEKATSSYDSKRCQKQKNREHPSIPRRQRRINPPWSEKELEKIRDGVQRFRSANKSIRWKMILEYGEDVFNVLRTDVDLKNKWKSLCKATPRFN